MADRAAAAKACRALIASAKQHPDIRMMIAHVVANRGHESLYAYADADPDAVIKLAEGVDFLDEQEPR